MIDKAEVLETLENATLAELMDELQLAESPEYDPELKELLLAEIEKRKGYLQEI